MRSVDTGFVRASATNARIDWFGWAGVTFAVAVCLWLRLPHLGAFNLGIDEVTIVEFARGVLERGYPYVMVGSMEVPLATYELLPYPMALSLALFGFSEWSVRLPSLLFSVATVILLHRTATRWFDRRVALLAALLFAVSPWAIYWGSNSFHPAQAQFLALLTLTQTWRVMQEQEPAPRAYYLTALYFSLAYLSWEGIGFLLPIMFISGLILNWGRWQWLQRRHLWYAVGLVACVVVIQGVRRVLYQVSYLMVGSGKSQVSMPQLVFTQSDYNPGFYLKHMFMVEIHVVLSVVFVLGLLLLRRSRNLRFVYALVIGAVFFLTNFLPFTSAHYIYWTLPLFHMAVGAVTFMAADAMVGQTTQQGPVVRAAVTAALVLMLALQLGTASSFGLKLYGVTSWQDPARTDLRVGLADPDYRGLIDEFSRQYREGDVVVTMATLPLSIYSGKRGDYFLQSITGQKVVYDPGAIQPYYVDKYAGVPVLRSQRELEDLLYRHRRVWLLVAPYSIFTMLQDPDLVTFVNNNFRTVAESYDGYLYLWEH